MLHYIDGFAFPVPSERLDEYKQVAEKVGAIYVEHGAIEYREFEGDDLQREGTGTFPTMLSAGEKETVVFGWIAYESRESRDIVNSKIASDTRLPELVSPLMESDSPVFDPTRMAFGGFKPLLQQTTSNNEVQ